VNIPIVPGIMPVSNFVRTALMAEKAGASVPRSVAKRFEGLENDIETRRLVAVAVAADQCQQLAEAGVSDFHFYTLNRADLTYALCHYLGLRPRPTAS
jgi:methylenetetrahydrofolate reductase (NADPH)